MKALVEAVLSVVTIAVAGDSTIAAWVQEDEGVEEVPGTEGGSDAAAPGGAWLASLGASGDAQEDAQNEQPAAPAEIDWLASLKGKRVPALAEAPSKAAKRPKRKDDGRALDIPPFWRTASIEELSESLQSLRERMLPRIRKMAKDARREDQKRGGHLKPRTAALNRV
ncbi:ANK1 [Symbiodinium sp. CCMP2592]|nr:ANK1 [Symbiodinium sp. CCMP2592]